MLFINSFHGGSLFDIFMKSFSVRGGVVGPGVFLHYLPLLKSLDTLAVNKLDSTDFPYQWTGCILFQ